MTLLPPLQKPLAHQPEVQMSTEILLEKITKALAFKYPGDRMVPGVTIANLKNGEFYVSIVRHCPNKKVIVKTRNYSLNEALKVVAADLLLLDGTTVKNPVDELADLITKNNSHNDDDMACFPDYRNDDLVGYDNLGL
jgi:hypothetical protein